MLIFYLILNLKCPNMPRFTLPGLNYDYANLESYIDTQTMQIHHTKHHQAYVDNLNKALASSNLYADQSLCQIIKNIMRDKSDDPTYTTILNNAGGHYNHSFFWLVMGPQSCMCEISEELKNLIDTSFGSFENMQKEFNEAAKKVFGSGWAWVCFDTKELKLVVKSSVNQENPYMHDETVIAILGIDVWEHAYYLKYQNERLKYVDAWWNIVNWKNVTRFYDEFAKVGNLVDIKDDGTLGECNCQKR